MRVPESGNPFGASVGIQSTQNMGLVAEPDTPYSDKNLLKSLGQAEDNFNKAFNAWTKQREDDQFKRYANDIKQQSDVLKNDPKDGYLTQQGMNALERQSGKTLTDEYSDNFKNWYTEAIQSKIKSSRLRQRVDDYFNAMHDDLRNGTNRWMIKQQGIVSAAEDARIVDLAFKDLYSDDEKDVLSGLATLKAQSEDASRKTGLREADYGSIYGKGLSLVFGRILDDKDIEAAKTFLTDNKQYFSAEDFAKNTDALRRAKKELEAEQAAGNIEKAWHQANAPAEVTRSVLKKLTGRDVDVGQFPDALELANGDAATAAAILSVGVDRWKEASKDGANPLNSTEQSTFDRVQQQYLDAVELSRDYSFDAICDEMLRMFPDAKEEDIIKAARKVSARKRQQVRAERFARDEATNAVFQALRNGTKFEEVPFGVRKDLSRSANEALRIYSERKEAGTLTTDPELYSDLQDDEYLKGLTDEQMYSLAHRLSESDFSMYEERRRALLTGRFKSVPEAKVTQMLKDSAARFGLMSPKDKEEKAAYGLIMKTVNEAVMEKIRLEHPDGNVRQEDVDLAFKSIMEREFHTLDNGYFWDGKEQKTVAEVVKKAKGLSLNNLTKRILNAGLGALGVNDPSDLNRTELAMRIKMFRNRRIPGASAMVETISQLDPMGYQTIMKGFAASRLGRGGGRPSDDDVVRAYMELSRNISGVDFDPKTKMPKTQPVKTPPPTPKPAKAEAQKAEAPAKKEPAKEAPSFNNKPAPANGWPEIDIGSFEEL